MVERILGKDEVPSSTLGDGSNLTNHLNRALSSAGSERLPYKQRVGGSNPSAPTQEKDGSLAQLNRAFDYGSKGCGFESRRSHVLAKVSGLGR